MSNFDVLLKKRNAANTDWDVILPITTAANVLVNETDTVEDMLSAVPKNLCRITVYSVDDLGGVMPNRTLTVVAPIYGTQYITTDNAGKAVFQGPYGAYTITDPGIIIGYQSGSVSFTTTQGENKLVSSIYVRSSVKLLSLTSSQTVSGFAAYITAVDVYLAGGGGNGGTGVTGSSSTSGSGGGGGGGGRTLTLSSVALSAPLVFVIGAAGGATTLTRNSILLGSAAGGGNGGACAEGMANNSPGGSGGSGGGYGGGGYDTDTAAPGGSNGSGGQGTPTIGFDGIKYCAGGGGGAGTAPDHVTVGAGGATGGGSGGSGAGGAATNYGCGGGGAHYRSQLGGGAGYQGIAQIRWA